MSCVFLPLHSTWFLLANSQNPFTVASFFLVIVVLFRTMLNGAWLVWVKHTMAYTYYKSQAVNPLHLPLLLLLHLSSDLWHSRLGHPSASKLQLLKQYVNVFILIKLLLVVIFVIFQNKRNFPFQSALMFHLIPLIYFTVIFGVLLLLAQLMVLDFSWLLWMTLLDALVYIYWKISLKLKCICHNLHLWY